MKSISTTMTPLERGLLVSIDELLLICCLFTMTLYNTFSSYVTPAHYISKCPTDPESHNGCDLL